MRKIIFTVFFVLIIQASFGCDICGCSSGNYFVGPFPWFHKHFVGIRYTFRNFHSIVKDNTAEFSKDFYQTAEVWGGWNIGKRWQALVFLPYNINRQLSDDGLKKKHAFGDITVIANYNLLNSTAKSKHGNGINQQLWIGAGLKLPTGKFSVDQDDLVPSVNNQSGSGSVDLILNSMYSMRINKWGTSTYINYKINHSSRDFKFGDRFNAAAFIFRSVATRKATFNPNAGLLYENLKANEQQDLKIEDTGGYALLASAGLETSLNKFAFGLNAQLPLSQHFSSGQTTTKVRGMLHVTYAF